MVHDSLSLDRDSKLWSTKREKKDTEPKKKASRRQHTDRAAVLEAEPPHNCNGLEGGTGRLSSGQLHQTKISAQNFHRTKTAPRLLRRKHNWEIKG